MGAWLRRRKSKARISTDYVSHGSLVLLLVRDGTASDWESLCGAFGLDPARSDTVHADLLFTVERLVEAGLLEVKENKDGLPWGSGRDRSKWGSLEISHEWKRIQSALGVSLVELAELMPFRSFVARPLLGLPDEDTLPIDIFVLMPFVPELRPVYDDHITIVADSLGLSVARADDIFKAGSVMEDVWNLMHACRILIADCTGRNPNVFYEIGLAHSIGKRVILLAQSDEDIPFDIKHLRYISYEYTPRGMKEFEARLVEALASEAASIGDTFWGD